jgi:hypothetical protein
VEILPYPLPPHVNIFVLGPAVINTHTETGWAVCEVWVDRMGGRRDGWIGGQKERVRGECRFSSLVKQKKREN